MDIDRNNPTQGTAVIGVVTGVFRKTGEADYIAVPKVGGRYIADHGSEVVYDVTVNVPDGVVQFEKLSPVFPRPFASFAIVCHPVGFPVQGVLMNRTLYLDFKEAPQEEICP